MRRLWREEQQFTGDFACRDALVCSLPFAVVERRIGFTVGADNNWVRTFFTVHNPLQRMGLPFGCITCAVH